MDDVSEQSAQYCTRLCNGDRKAFSQLYDHFSPVIYGEILRSVRDLCVAEELLQDTFINVYQNIHQFDPLKGRLYTWIIAIARNKCIDHFRKRKHIQRELVDTDLISDGESAVYQLELRSARIQVARLPPLTKAVFELVYFSGYTHQEAAQICMIPLGTLKTIIRTTLQKFARRCAKSSDASIFTP